MLDFIVDFADIDTRDADANQHEATHQPYGQDERRPAGYCCTGNQGVKHVNADTEADEQEGDA